MTDIAGGGLVAQAARPAPGGAGEGELLMDDDHTASLLCAWREGDQSALGRLLAQNEDWMRAQVRRRIARHELHHLLIEEQEIVQEGVSELLRSHLRFVPKNGAQFRQLLWRILNHTLDDELDRRRAQKRDPRREELRLEDSDLADSFTDQTAPSSDAVLEEDEKQANLLHAMGLLREQDRKIICLRRLEELSFKEIASRLGLSTPDAARMRFNGAMNRLRAALRKAEN